MPKNVIGKLRLTVVSEWVVDNLKHYNAENLQQAADVTNRQLNEGDASFEDAMGWEAITSFKVEVVKP
jgi:hypothetical protein